MDNPLRADTKQSSSYGADASTHKWVNDGSGHTKDGTYSLTDADDVISQSLSEKVGCGDPAEPQHGEVDGRHCKTDQSYVLLHVNSPTIDDRCEGREQM